MPTSSRGPAPGNYSNTCSRIPRRATCKFTTRSAAATPRGSSGRRDSRLSSGPMRTRSFLAFLALAACTAVDTSDPELGPLNPTSLPTGQVITPTLAPFSSFGPLNPALARYPDLAVGGAVTEALSPDGNTLAVLT